MTEPHSSTGARAAPVIVDVGALDGLKLASGLLDLRSERQLNLREIRERSNPEFKSIVLLPGDLADRGLTARLQRLLHTVWLADAGVDGEPALVTAFRMLASGANGIVTADPDLYRELLESHFPADQPTLLRRPFTIGHRGLPAKAPENTLAGARLALEQGADMIENDVHLSSDGHIVIHHDETLDRTTDGTGNLAEFTLAELSRLRANRQFPADYPNEGIPTLRSFLETFRHEDVVHVIEIKSTDPAITEPLARLVEETGTLDQVVMISFHADQLTQIRGLLPGVSTGYLTGGQVNELQPAESLRAVLELVRPLHSTYNPLFMGVGPEFVRAAARAGLSVWPWTINDETLFAQMYLWGFGGLTTNHAHWTAKWATRLDAPGSLTLDVGTELRPQARLTLGDRSVSDVPVEPVLIQSDGSMTGTDGALRALRPGSSWAVLRCWQETVPGQGYFIISEPVRIESRNPIHHDRPQVP